MAPSSEPPLLRCNGCKPDSVRPGYPCLDDHFSRESEDSCPSCDECDDTRGFVFPLERLRSRRPLPLFCLAPHRVYRAPAITCRAVGSYPAFSSLPRGFPRGGLFSVTLSVGRSFRSYLPCVLHGMLPSGVRTFLQDFSQRSSAVTR